MGEGVSGFIALLYIALGVWLALRHANRAPEPEQEEQANDFDSIRLEGEIEALHKKMLKLRQLDEMIIDLRLCRPAEVQKAFRMEWMSEAGTNHAFDFIADGGNPSTEYLLSLAVAEREEVNEDIKRRIFDLYCRACYENFSEVVDREKYPMPSEKR